jgi:hypothetical protein
MFKTLCNIKEVKGGFNVGPLDWQVNSCVPSITISVDGTFSENSWTESIHTTIGQ